MARARERALKQANANPAPGPSPRERHTPMETYDFARVAIDGPVSSGKTTVLGALARRLDLLYLNTGDDIGRSQYS